MSAHPVPAAAALRRGLAALLLAALPCAAAAVQDCDIGGVSVNPANGHTTAGKSGFMRCVDRDSGQLMREQELANGVFMGVVRHYQNGKLAREHRVNAKGNVDGVAREYAPGGPLLREATYADGTIVGLARAFHPNGQPQRVSFHQSPGGEQAVAEFNESGQLMALRCGELPMLTPAVDDTRLCGFAGPATVDLFDAKGQARGQATYTGGQRVRAQLLHPNGKPAVVEESAGELRTERRFSPQGTPQRDTQWRLTERGAVKQREVAYAERGTPLREQQWDAQGQLQVDNAYYLNGQPRSKAVYGGEGQARTVEITQFHDSGLRAAQGQFRLAARGRQLPTGVHERFNPQGRKVAELHYDGEGRPTRERSWDDTGTLQRDDEVFADGSRKAYAR